MVTTAQIKAELDDLASPRHADYVAAGWELPLPVMQGDATDLEWRLDKDGSRTPERPEGNPKDTAGRWVHANPLTQVDNNARAVQADIYTAIAAVLNDPTTMLLPESMVTEKQFADALDQIEWDALTQANRDYIGTLQRVRSTEWMAECLKLFEAANTTTTKDTLAALKCSRSMSLGLPVARAGHIKAARGDEI